MNKNPTTQTLCSSREIQEELFLGPGYMIGKIPYTQKVQFKLNKTQYLKIFYGLSKQNFVLIYFGFTPAQVTRYPGEKIKKKVSKIQKAFFCSTYNLAYESSRLWQAWSCPLAAHYMEGFS